MAKKAGRPKIEIDAKLVEQFASLGCKNKEIAAYFGCSEDTIERNYAAEMDKGRSNLKMSLRQMQIGAAKKGNVAMLIWLGKQYLDQREQTQLILEKIPDDLLAMEAKRRLEDADGK